MITDIINAINTVLWGRGQVLIYMLLIGGVFFTWKLGFIQIKYFTHMFSIMRNSTASDKAGISSFQALCTSLSARVGTGNLAGVAVAISLGGAGAIFWMWVIAFLGMATGFAESVLGQLYKVKDTNGEYRGGPAYYIQQGLKKRWLAVLFSLCLFLGYGFIFSAVQANTITDALNNAYGIDTLYSGLVIIGLAALIVVGGFRTIANFAQWVVPFMGVSYVLVALVIMGINIDLLPGVLSDIVLQAFGLQEAVAGRNDIHVPYTRLVCIENTTNKGGGACWDFSELEKLQQISKENNLAFHLDGARLFNALVAKNETPKQYGQLFDTISICLSKGLGAPIGSILLGSKEDIAKALRIRKLFGGAMRQVGFLAAAGIYALDNNIERLAEDHQKAKEIANVLESCVYVTKIEPVETNILIFYVDDKIGADNFISKMATKNILLTPMGEGRIRIVTHLDYTDEMHKILLKELKNF